jgi:hypothetical protein
MFESTEASSYPLQLRNPQIQQLHPIPSEVNVRTRLRATTFDVHDDTITKLRMMHVFSHSPAHIAVHLARDLVAADFRRIDPGRLDVRVS